MLYRRGRPTSIVLLLLMVIPKLSLSLSRHSPLGLHHLLRLVGAARGLVSLGGVEVLQVARGVLLVGAAAADAWTAAWTAAGTGSAAGVAVVGDRVWSRAASSGSHSAVWAFFRGQFLEVFRMVGPASPR